MESFVRPQTDTSVRRYCLAFRSSGKTCYRIWRLQNGFHVLPRIFDLRTEALSI